MTLPAIAEDIYPVQFSPATWADYLTTDFEPVDLLMAPGVLMQQLKDTEFRRRTLIDRLSDLQGSLGSIDGLQRTVETARVSYTVGCETPSE